ncbi:MAG TPA: hypothetical protein VKB12_13735, partial [Pyrinomonadaceae bacterium]|nr:hypothetical protein [Pyrinomonadaceae bacterium]
MQSNLLKPILLGVLIAVTVVSFDLGGRPEGKEIGGPTASAGVEPLAPPVVSAWPGQGGANVPATGHNAGDASGGPYKPDEVSRKALVVFKPPPGSTEEARRSEVAGVVRLRA